MWRPFRFWIGCLGICSFHLVGLLRLAAASCRRWQRLAAASRISSERRRSRRAAVRTRKTRRARRAVVRAPSSVASSSTPGMLLASFSRRSRLPVDLRAVVQELHFSNVFKKKRVLVNKCVPLERQTISLIVIFIISTLSCLFRTSLSWSWLRRDCRRRPCIRCQPDLAFTVSVSTACHRRSAVSRAGLHIHFEALAVVHGVPVHGGVRVVIAPLLLCFGCILFAWGVPHRIADSHEPRQDLSQDEQS